MTDVSRRDIVSGAAAGLLVAGAETAFAKPPPSQPSPNILWLVSEDNNPLIGAYGDRLAYTPNIDALAHGGLLYRHVGTDTLSRPGRKDPSPTLGSGGDGRGFPCPVSPGAQDPETWSGDQVGLQIEGVVDGGVAGEEPLS